MATDISERVVQAFFGTFGKRLRPIQEATFAQLEAGRDGLIVAPTGSGKTEAALAPVAQRLYGGASGQLRALIITPRQALGGDLYARMAGAFAALSLRLDVATGDKNTQSVAHPSDILIRTPEGLDSTLVRNPMALISVQEVVIDEIHTFLQDPRGTQLVGLLERLSTIAPGFRRLGVSATVPDSSAPERVGLLDDPIKIHASHDEGKLDLQWFDWHGEYSIAGERFLKFLRGCGVKKAIGFARSKAKVETLAKMLNQGYVRDRVFVHHSGISRSSRSHTEQMLRGLPSALVVATTTLEVGIDIGSVDTCI